MWVSWEDVVGSFKAQLVGSLTLRPEPSSLPTPAAASIQPIHWTHNMKASLAVRIGFLLLAMVISPIAAYRVNGKEGESVMPLSPRMGVFREEAQAGPDD